MAANDAQFCKNSKLEHRTRMSKLKGRNQKKKKRGGGGRTKERMRGQNEKVEYIFNQTHRRKQQNETKKIHEEIMAIN